MSSGQAKPIKVRVLTHDGRELGTLERRPVAANWRNIGPRRPTITLTRGRRVLCERVGDAWAVRVALVEQLPADLVGGDA